MTFSRDLLLKSSEWLRLIPGDLAEKLLDRAKVFSVSEGSLIYDLDDDPIGLYCVVSGVVAVKTDNPETEAICAHLMGAGSWLGEIAALTHQKSAIGVEARTRCVMIVVPKAALEDLGRIAPDLWRAMAVLAALNARKAMLVARDAMIRDARERLEAVLDRLAGEIGLDTAIPLTQDQLAGMCNLSLRATSKLLRELSEERRVACGYRAIQVLSSK
ncbi:MAG: Crp/Fnr family transcriptional regulator [Roseobacter sp.]|jgi:CRP-like cAMP-binding protein|nr:Crp/Fnr family transcriptional regulator [Roseobacter sp.]